MDGKSAVAAIIVIIVIIVAVAYLVSRGGIYNSSNSYTTGNSLTYPTNSSSSTTPTTAPTTTNNKGTPIMLIDPSQLPSGTSAMMISYSAIVVGTNSTGASSSTTSTSSISTSKTTRVTGAGSNTVGSTVVSNALTSNGYGNGMVPASNTVAATGNVATNNTIIWTSATGSGSLNLTRLVNSSQVIGYVTLPSNSMARYVRFTVTSAKITVNGNTYNVTLPNSTITATVDNRMYVDSNSALIVDFSPVVTPSYNGTVARYLMVPSARAVVVHNMASSAITSVGIGTLVSINASDKASIGANALNISIVSAAISAGANNVTNLQFKVEDSSTNNVILDSALVYGPLSANIVGTVGGGLSPAPSAVPPAGYAVRGPLGNSNSDTNFVGTNTAVTVTTNAMTNNSVITSQIDSSNEIYFGVSSDGKLILPENSSVLDSSGYALAPGGMFTFTYGNSISYDSGKVHLNLFPGDKYKIVVVGSDGVSASTNVTAT